METVITRDRRPIIVEHSKLVAGLITGPGIHNKTCMSKGQSSRSQGHVTLQQRKRQKSVTDGRIPTSNFVRISSSVYSNFEGV